MTAFGWLSGGNDRQLAATTYKGRESASDRKARIEAAAEVAKRSKKQSKDRVARSKGATRADRAGQAWEAQDRRQFSR